MRNVLFVLAAVLLAAVPASGQVLLEGWLAHTSFGSVLAVDRSGETVWAATRGGVFSYEEGSGEIRRYTVIDGLASVETRTLEVDTFRGVVWIGYGSGVFDRLDPESGSVTTFRDIERADQFASRGVNRIVATEDVVLMATDFGIVVFDPIRGEVRDSYTRLGTFTAATKTSDIVLAPDGTGISRVWVASVEGLAHAPSSGLNLQDPASWTNESSGFMTSQDDATALAVFEGRLYVGTTTDLYLRRGPGDFVRQFVSSTGVQMMDAGSGRLLGVSRFNGFVVAPGGQASILGLPTLQDPTSVVGLEGSEAWLGDLLGGLVRVDTATDEFVVEQTVVPEGPSESTFNDLAVGSEGVLWAGGSTETGSGFQRFGSDGVWTAYTPVTTPALSATGSWLHTTADAQGNGWAGSEGNGVVQVTPNGEVVRFTPANSSLVPTPGSPNFVIVGGLDADSGDNLWVTTRATARPLHVRTAGGDWAALGPYVGDGLSQRATAYGRIYVDSFDQKWIIVRNENSLNLKRGLMVLDTARTPADESDDSFRFFDAAGADGLGLPSPSVSAVVEDRDGLVWVGTDSGLAYFINTGVVARDATARAIWPQWADRRRGVFVLFGLSINDLAVDPANRLWVATHEGAWLIEAVEGGYDLVRQFTTDNSPLFSNTIVALEVDPESGEVFFATDRGLLSYQGDAIAPAPAAEDLFVYPNPVRGGGVVVIEGLVESAQVKILTPSGDTVAQFTTRGGRATWNGRDRDGRLVPTGVYLVVAVGDDDQGAAYGKVAIIR